MWREKMNRLVAAHRDDDREEALRFRNVPAEERARLMAALCRQALAALGGRPSPEDPRSPEDEAWWRAWVARERGRIHA